MEIGMVGLGRMGGSMAHRLLKKGHQVITYDVDLEAVNSLLQQGATSAVSLEDLAAKLDPPRVAWVMLPAGEQTEQTISRLSEIFVEGDTIIDGGNSHYVDTVRRASSLHKLGIKFLDVGTSGGVWGLDQGYNLMIGGDEEAFRTLRVLFQALAPEQDKGYGYVGPSGSGHFVKMVHNGIEYGMMQAYAEGFEIMRAKGEFALNLSQVAEIWRHGSVIRSWLLDLTANALDAAPNLESVESYVDDSGQGRWIVQESVDLAIPIPVIALALQSRFRSRQDSPFGGRLLAAMRNQFGGHSFKSPSDE
jgi:6-phosphogluconate dehydrogenase